MKEIVKLLSSIRPPTASFVNDETFPTAIEVFPALKSIAASGFRGNREFDDGFMSTASAAYDALVDASLEKHLEAITVEVVAKVDKALQEDKDFAKKVLTELSLDRYMKSKAKDNFKAGALLALVSIAYADGFVEDDDKPRDTVPEGKLGEPTEDETMKALRFDTPEEAPADRLKGCGPIPPEEPKGLMSVLKAVSVGFPGAPVEVIPDFSVEPPKLAVRINMLRSSIPLLELMQLYARLTNVGLSKAELCAMHDTLGFFLEILDLP